MGFWDGGLHFSCSILTREKNWMYNIFMIMRKCQVDFDTHSPIWLRHGYVMCYISHSIYFYEVNIPPIDLLTIRHISTQISHKTIQESTDIINKGWLWKGDEEGGQNEWNERNSDILSAIVWLRLRGWYPQNYKSIIPYESSAGKVFHG